MENKAAERIKEEVNGLEEAYAQERQSAQELVRGAVDTSREAVEFADSWVRYNTWKLLGITMLFGVIVGLLAGRRSDRESVTR